MYPSSAYEAKGLLAAALESEDPVVFFEPIVFYDAPAEEVPEQYFQIPIGKAKVVQPGDDLTIVAYGPPVHTAMRAAELLAEDSITAEVIDLRTLSPWDEDTVLSGARRTGRLLTVHEDSHTGGFGAEIAATAAERLGVAVARVAHADQPWAANRLDAAHSKITVERIVRAAKSLVEQDIGAVGS